MDDETQELPQEVFDEVSNHTNPETFYDEENHENSVLALSNETSCYRKKLDMTSGQYFYVNVDTEETFWDKPLPGPVPLLELPPERRKQLERERQATLDTKKKAQADRLRLIEKRHADHRRKVSLQKKEEKEAEIKKRAQLWHDALFHARKTGEVNMSWQRLGDVSPTLYEFEAQNGRPVTGLHLIGHEMQYLPESLPPKLLGLTALSLASNRITALPESLTLLTGLKELNLLRNKIEHLPEDIGKLSKLENILISSNKLLEIPPSFGKLVKLERIVLDCNHIKKIPEELGTLRVHTFSINSNNLIDLPHCFKEMVNLTALSVNNNHIQYLPYDIGDCKKLKKLHVCGNHLLQLPDSIARLSELQTLWLDHNSLAALPMRFHDLKRLTVLKLEGNLSMVYPTMDKIMEGTPAVMQWCQDRLNNRIFRRRQTIVLSFQELLKQVLEYDLGRTQVFEPGVQFQEDKWYVFVLECFWSEMLPALEQKWANGETRHGQMTGFQYERSEVESVLESYKDPYGPVMIKRRCMFRRCACLDPDNPTKRKVCIPPKHGWMCERDAVMVKEYILLERELIERERQHREKQYVIDAQDIARGLVEDYADTEEGKQYYTEKAVEQAEILMEAKKHGKFESQGEALLAKRKAEIEKKFAKKRRKIEKERIKRLTDLKQMRTDMEEQLKGLQGWAKDQQEKKLDKVLDDMENLPEELELARLESELAAALKEAGTSKERRRFKKRGLFKRLMDHFSGERDDLVEQLRIDLIRQDGDRDAEKAKREAERNNVVFRNIMGMWLGLGMRETFNQWKFYIKQKIRQRKRDLRENRRLARRKYEALMASVRLAEWKLSKYDKFTDVYSDEDYWVQRDTNEIRNEEPQLEDFLPPGYKIPDRPAAMDEDTTSSSGSDWSTDETTSSEEEESETESESDSDSDDGSSTTSEKQTESQPVYEEKDEISGLELESEESDYDGSSEEDREEERLARVRRRREAEDQLVLAPEKDEQGQLMLVSGEDKENDMQKLQQSLIEFKQHQESSSKREDEAAVARKRMAIRRQRGVAIQNKQLEANKEARELARAQALLNNTEVKDIERIRGVLKRRGSADVHKEVGYDPTKQYTNKELNDMAKLALKLNKAAGITENAGVGSLEKDGYVYGRDKNFDKKRK